MGHKKSKNKSRNTYRDENETTNMNLSSDDIQALNLLDSQLKAQIINMVSVAISYKATIEGIELVYNKDDEVQATDIDILVMQSVYLGLVSNMIFTEIGFSRYRHLYEKYINGEIDYSLQPNIDINTSNIFGLISEYYAVKAVQGIYERDSNQPIFGK